MNYEEELEKQNDELLKKLASANTQLARYKNNGSLKIPTLSKQWNDRDEVMLHTVFAVLVEFIEGEWKGKCEQYTRRDYAAAQTSKEKNILKIQGKEKKELFSLYLWWKNEYPRLSEDPKWHVKGYKIETKKAMRVVELRRYLWT